MTEGHCAFELRQTFRRTKWVWILNRTSSKAYFRVRGDSPTMAFKLRFAGSASPVTLFFPLFMRFSCPPACGVDPFPVSPFVFPKERVAALAPLARAELIDIGRERCHSLHHDKLSARCKVTLSPSRPLMKGRPHGRPSSTSITGLARPSNNRPGQGLSRGCYCLSGRVNIVGKR
jgi:hypothetical protein